MEYEMQEWSDGWSVIGRKDGEIIYESPRVTEDEAWKLYLKKTGGEDE